MTRGPWYSLFIVEEFSYEIFIKIKIVTDYCAKKWCMGDKKEKFKLINVAISTS